MQRIGLQRGQEPEQKKIVLSPLSSLYVVSFSETTTNKIIDEYLDTEFGIECVLFGMRGSAFSMRVGEEEEDVETWRWWIR